MTQPLNEFISSVRLAESIEQERFIIATEQAHIRAYLRKCDPVYRPRIICKLIFLDIIGQNPVWGQMEAMTLMSDEQFSYKRIGYIGASVLLDESADLTVLVTQTLLKDLANPDPNIQALALCYIANHGNAEVCRAVSSAVQKTIESQNAVVMKRAGMAIVRIVRQNPDLAETFKNSVQKLLNHTNHGVVLAGMNMVINLIKIEPRLGKLWSQFAGPFTRILKSLHNSRGTREFSYGVFNDPYMQIKAMLALTLLQKPSEELDGILQSIVSSTETRRNTGRAVLYQAVELVVSISKTASLRGLAFNQVGRLLSMKDPNVLYSALSVFARVLYTERDMINRSSVDTQALQRYKKHIVRCLDHRDPSIRRRALDVISALIDENNVETLIPEIIGFIRLADADFRCELIAKIYAAIQRFSKSKEWTFDTVHQILVDSGNYVSADIITDFCDLIGKSPELQQHAVRQLGASMLQFSDNQALMQVSAFVIGEFAAADNGTVESLRQIIALPQTKAETKFYIIMALGKLAVRLGQREEIAALMDQLRHSNDLEVQQRAGEIANILRMDGLCEEFLSPIPVKTDEAAAKPAVAKAAANPEKKEQVDDLLMMVMDGPSDGQKPKSSAPQSADDLLLLLGSAPQPVPVATPPNSSTDLLGMLSTQEPPKAPAPIHPITQTAQTAIPPQNPAVVPTPAPIGPPPGSKEVLRMGDYVIYGQGQPNPAQPNQIAVRLIVFNTSPKDLTDFRMEFGPPVGWKVMAKPPDGVFLGANGSKPITQVVFLLNEGNTPFGLQVRAKYRYGTQPVTETGVIRSL